MRLEVHSLAEGEGDGQHRYQGDHGDVGQGAALEGAAVLEDAAPRHHQETAEGIQLPFQEAEGAEIRIPNLLGEEIDDSAHGTEAKPKSEGFFGHGGGGILEVAGSVGGRAPSKGGGEEEEPAGQGGAQKHPEKIGLPAPLDGQGGGENRHPLPAKAKGRPREP